MLQRPVPDRSTGAGAGVSALAAVAVAGASEFRTENRVSWLGAPTRTVPVVLTIAFALGLGTFRFDPAVLPIIAGAVLVAAILGYLAIRSLIERRRVHIKIGSDWIRIRRGGRLLSAPLHTVVIERSVMSRRRFRISHPRGQPAFTISLNQFPETQREDLADLLNAHSRPVEGALADITGIDSPTLR